MEGVCDELFPQLGDTHYGGDFYLEARRRKRVCSPDIFRTYFKLGVPRGSVSSIELGSLRKSLDSEQDFYDNLSRLNKEGKLRKILSRFLDYNDGLSASEIKNLIGAVWKIQEEVINDRTNVWDFDDAHTGAERLIYQSVKKNITPSDRATLIAEVFRRSQSLYPSTQLVRVLTLEQGKRSEREVLLEEGAGIDELKKIGLEKMRNARADGTLRKHSHIIPLLYSWRDFGGEDEAKQYLAGILGSNEGVLEFLENAVTLVLSSNGNYHTINKQDIEPLYPIEDLKKQVDKLTDEELAKATEAQRKAVDLFKNPKSIW